MISNLDPKAGATFCYVVLSLLTMSMTLSSDIQSNFQYIVDDLAIFDGSHLDDMSSSCSMYSTISSLVSRGRPTANISMRYNNDSSK